MMETEDFRYKVENTVSIGLAFILTIISFPKGQMMMFSIPYRKKLS